MLRNGNGCKNTRNSLVAATFEKANTYVFAALIIRDREVGGSNPLAPTSQFTHLRAAHAARSRLLWGLLCRSSFEVAKPYRCPSPLQSVLELHRTANAVSRSVRVAHCHAEV